MTWNGRNKLNDMKEEMEMPTPCHNCGEWFDLNEGSPSYKWFPSTIICSDCEHEEAKEIERDEEIEDLKNQIEDAKITIKYATERLKELQEEQK